MDLWHCQINGGSEGPFAVSLLQIMVQEGKLTPETPVCRVGDQQWIAAAQIPGLFAAAGEPVPPPLAPTPLPMQPSAATVQAAPGQPTPVTPLSPSSGQPPGPAAPLVGAVPVQAEPHAVAAATPHSAAAGNAEDEGPTTAADRMLQRRRRNSAGVTTYVFAIVGLVLVLLVVVVALLVTGGKDDEKKNANQPPPEPLLTAQLAMDQTAPWREAGRTTSTIGKRARIRVVSAHLKHDLSGSESGGMLLVEVEVENMESTILEFQDARLPLPAGSIDPTKPLAMDASGRFLKYAGPTYVVHQPGASERVVSHQIGARAKDTLQFEFLCEADPGPHVRVAIPLAWFQNRGFLGFQVARAMWEDPSEGPPSPDPERPAEAVEGEENLKVLPEDKSIDGPASKDGKGKLPQPVGFGENSTPLE